MSLVLGIAVSVPAAFAVPVLTAPTTVLLASVGNSLIAPTITGSYVESVYADPSNPFGAGDLTFVISMTDTGGSDTIQNITTGSFKGVSAVAGYTSASSVAPISESISSTGVENYAFTGLTKGQTEVLVIQTNATAYVPGYVSIEDSTSTSNVGFGPTLTPEPASLALIGGGLLGVAMLRRRSAKK